MQKVGPRVINALACAVALGSAALAASSCRDRASEEDCRQACKNSVELSYWEDLEEARDLDARGERAREREIERGERRLERMLEEGGDLYETVQGCADVCRQTPTPPEVVACQLEAESVAELNACMSEAPR